MSIRARLPVTIAIAVVLSVLGHLPVGATASGIFSDDDGIPEERNIEHLVGLGILEGCDESEEDRYCPGEPATLSEAVKSLIRGVVHLEGRPLPIPPDPLVEGVARLLSRSAAFSHGDPLSEAAFARAVVRSFGDAIPADFGVDVEEPLSRAALAEMLAVALGEDQCRDDPFTTERVSALAERYPRQSFQAYAHDTRTGCSYWMNPSERLRTASVIKVMVMAGTLLEAQEDGRDLTQSEWDALVPMITESANWPVRSLWRRFGASPWFGEQAEIFGLEETTVIGDAGPSWGATRTSAKDQADLIRQVLVGEWGPLELEYREIARELMTSVVESQTWGVTSGVPDGWTVAQKNGFAGSTTNSVGYVEAPEGDRGYVIAVLTNGWPGWRSGVETVEEIAGWVSSALIAER